MARTTMPAMKANGGSGIQPLQAAAQVAPRGAQEQVIMVIHHTKGKNPQPVTLVGRGQEVQEASSVIVLQENRLPVIAPRGYMVKRVREFYAPGPGHDRSLSSTAQPVKP